ncbi:MAG: tRNA (guanosine(37)-N1)-methyltransferase TrmD [Thermodesulfobacteriota bacterium]|nr:tRNA (guanosine(37)-N1)-methyltransferase TrmD [Candidatus Dadabacteria bacterium]
MRYDILTIFPEFFESPFSIGILKKAQEKGLIELNTYDIRDYTDNKHRTVDDTPYGGGGGMLMKVAPISAAIEDVKSKNAKSLVILTTPDGEKFTDKTARELAYYEQIIIICGRYEGVDERIREIYVDKEISIGDYVLSGGENAASVIVESVSRFIPGVLGNELSPENDSFNEGLLEYPQYTRPEEFEGKKVPDVLLSGNHKEIDEWRKKESIKRTFRKRPDMLDKAILKTEEIDLVKELKETNPASFKAYIALIHYPVYNNQLKIINTAFTNLDVHDIARSAVSYGIEKFYLVQPNLEQQKLVNRVLKHWTTGEGASFNKSRSEALHLVALRDTLQDVTQEIEEIEGEKPLTIVTDARSTDNMIGFGDLRELIFSGEQKPYLILFGTGWGLAKEIMESADYTLKPVSGYTNYNHLSVRSAAAIILDRLFSCKI